MGAESRGTICCELNLKGCQTVFAQMMMMSRLRTLFTSGGGEVAVKELSEKMTSVRNEIKGGGDAWLEPKWWSPQCDLGLMVGLVEKSFDGFEDIFSSKRYRIIQDYEAWVEEGGAEEGGEGGGVEGGGEGGENKKTGRPKAKASDDLMQTRAVCQIRVAHLVREFNRIESRKEQSAKASAFFGKVRGNFGKGKNSGTEQGEAKKRKVEGGGGGASKSTEEPPEKKKRGRPKVSKNTGGVVAKNLEGLNRLFGGGAEEPAASMKIKKKGGGGGLKTTLVEDNGGSILAPKDSNGGNRLGDGDGDFLSVQGGIKRKKKGGGE